MPWRAGERVVETMPVGFMSLDADWRITYINPAGEAVVGQTRAQLVGADYWTAFPASAGNEFGRAYRSAATTGQPVRFEAFYPHPLNRWYEVQALSADGGLLLYFTDVTERRGAQERLAMLARVSAELAGTLDVDTAAPRIPRLIVPVLGDWCVLSWTRAVARTTSAGGTSTPPSAPSWSATSPCG
jgi:PAS domain S-box-containing protein